MRVENCQTDILHIGNKEVNHLWTVQAIMEKLVTVSRPQCLAVGIHVCIGLVSAGTVHVFAFTG